MNKKWYVSEYNGYIMDKADLNHYLQEKKIEEIQKGYYTEEEAPTLEEIYLNSDEIAEYDEDELYNQIFWRLIDYIEEDENGFTFYGIHFTATKTTLTANGTTFHYPEELRSYFESLDKFDLYKIIEEYNTYFAC